MHRYDIYLLKTEYANSFVRAEDKLFRLFKEYETVKPLYEIVKKNKLITFVDRYRWTK
ncbi:sporulation inhibitor of replication protein SirA [Geomicrobium sp. JCM 19055]|uniref:sporulation inhibitor of replication protein SirA n=1 Tax=Geomicrobium sp. JCM 19055 TaxID=1460649 RepID=UPI00045ED973|nr:sporulation inhibitor of replication protein SirA [Geomicrobium sp. JCM 19055]GAK01676.1 hypothetical protein JCM19055_4876 [Geomicrobium sp. JCM 19055]